LAQAPLAANVNLALAVSVVMLLAGMSADAEALAMMEEGRSPLRVDVSRGKFCAFGWQELVAVEHVSGGADGQAHAVCSTRIWPASATLEVGDVCRVISTVIARVGDALDSEILTEWPAKTQVQVLAVGRPRRVCVRNLATGWEGWVSTWSLRGRPLLRRTFPMPRERRRRSSAGGGLAPGRRRPRTSGGCSET